MAFQFLMRVSLKFLFYQQFIYYTVETSTVSYSGKIFVNQSIYQ